MSLFYHLQINKLLRSIKQTKHGFCAKVLVHKPSEKLQIV